MQSGFQDNTEARFPRLEVNPVQKNILRVLRAHSKALGRVA